MFCLNCGVGNDDENQLCIKCGSPLRDLVVDKNAAADGMHQSAATPDAQKHAMHQPTESQADAQSAVAEIHTHKSSKRTLLLAAAIGAIVAAFVFFTLFFAYGFGSSSGRGGYWVDANTNEIVTQAIESLKQEWGVVYSDDIYLEGEGFLEIKNTRILYTFDNIDEGTAAELFGDVDYIVEFLLYTNLYESAPYYMNHGLYDTVTFYSDGSIEVPAMSLLHLYRNYTLTYDFSTIVESVEDLGSAYNAVYTLN